jgi:hypothetical protein
MLNTDLGFYTCGQQQFTSKVDALLYAQATDSKVDWVFHDWAYSQHTWDQEPTASMDALYDARSRELREKYDYIVLSFSGGADTNNILESFIRQGLHIDEIVTNHMGKATSGTTVLDPNIKSNWNFAAEHELQAVPRLQYIYDKLPRTKITVLDVSDVVVDSMKTMFTDVDWVLHRNDHLSVGQLFRYNYFYFSELKKKFDKNLRVGIIVGADKPKTYIDANSDFWVAFTDINVNITTINDFNSDYTNVATELFYWGNSTAPLVCKQAHVIKRWLENNPRYQPVWKSKKFSVARLVQERILRNLLYTTWNDSWYQADKSTAWWYIEFDTWFHQRADLKHEQQLWKSGIDYLAQKLKNSDHLILGADKNPVSFRTFTKQYKIGKLKDNAI